MFSLFSILKIIKAPKGLKATLTHNFMVHKMITKCNLIEPVTCSADISVFEAAKTLEKSKLRQLVVVEDDKPIGILSETDIVYKVVAQGKTPKDVLVKDIMNSPVTQADIKDKINDAYLTMAQQGIYSIPIVEDGKLKGILSFNEALRHLAK
jgi:CBS domain-containing protein